MAHGNIELFSDYFAQETNALTLIDARLKLIFVLATLILALTIGQPGTLLLISLLCIISLVLVGIPLKVLLVRYSGPLVVASMLIVLQGLFFGETALYSLKIAGFTLSLHQEGLDKGILIAVRVIAGVSLVILLSMTTPVNKLLAALKFFKVSDSWLELVSFTYRYIFVFIDETQSIMDSQRLRLGYNGVARSLRSWGVLVGSLFTRAYDQANATHSAMLLRGYSGKFHLQPPGALTQHDLGAGLIMLAIYGILLAVTVFGG